METNQAIEHLQVIRTLMERSALYRRALAPIMIYCGTLGILGGLAGGWFQIDFALYWSGVALAALSGSFLLVRRQAWKEAEPFWSPPTRRVAQALVAPLCLGLCWNIASFLTHGAERFQPTISVMVWTALYGCALHSAGFFMPRGIRLFSWLFLLIAILLLAAQDRWPTLKNIPPHLLMGAVFGGMHLAYGGYLYVTEQRKTAP